MDNRKKIEEDYCWLLHDLMENEELCYQLELIREDILDKQNESILETAEYIMDSLYEQKQNEKESIKEGAISFVVSEALYSIILLIASNSGIDITKEYAIGYILFAILMPLISLLDYRKERDRITNETVKNASEGALNRKDLDTLYDYTLQKIYKLEGEINSQRSEKKLFDINLCIM